MKTPIADFVREYSTRGATRMHMPGHKGKPLVGPEAHDITEIDGADVLFSPKGIILESEENASRLFGTGRTVYSTEGSSLSIKAMLSLLFMRTGRSEKKPLVLAARNAHKAFLCAAALLDFDIEWIRGESLIHQELTRDDAVSAIERCQRKPDALYVTSPDYLGGVTDIAMLADECHKRGILLLVDNAHGAYLKFLPKDNHPITLGADMCCDSAHKTLPVLTGGGYLHISKAAPSEFLKLADEAMSLFASTSPSYLILESLDLANKYIDEAFKAKLDTLLPKINSARHKIEALGIPTVGNEELKITLAPTQYGYTGTDIGKIFKENGIYIEFCDRDFATLMISTETTSDELDLLVQILKGLKKRVPIDTHSPTMPTPRSAMSPREAMLSPSESVPVRDALGRVLSSASVSCPPAVPILISGEVIDEAAIRVFEYYGIDSLRVVKRI